MRELRNNVMLAIVIALVMGCGGDTTIALGDAPDAYASAYCERALACCTLGELAGRFPDASPAITDQPSCRAYVARVFGNEFTTDTIAAQGAGSARYHGEAMALCLAAIRTEPCTDLARVLALMTVPTTCPVLREPLVADGGACDHDFECVSAVCAVAGPGFSGACAAAPSPGAPCTAGKCGPGAYCDRSADGAGSCAALGDVGSACSSNLACTSLDCQAATCAPPAICVGS